MSGEKNKYIPSSGSCSNMDEEFDLNKFEMKLIEDGLEDAYLYAVKHGSKLHYDGALKYRTENVRIRVSIDLMKGG
jgi:hypothetical protein